MKCKFYIIIILLGCGGACIAGSTTGAIFAIGIITVTVIVLIIIMRKKNLIATAGMCIQTTNIHL